MRLGRVVDSDGRTLVPDVALADGVFTRLRGLLGRPPLRSGEGLWLTPCGSVHTVGMRVVIDVAFIGTDGRVLAIHSNLAPFRFALVRGARHALELGAGACERHGLSPGLQVAWTDRS